MRSLLYVPLMAGVALAAGSCPFMSGEMGKRDEANIKETTEQTEEFMGQFKLNDQNGFMTTDWGTPVDDLRSLRAGIRGPTLLEDFTFRQKLQRFDHERVRLTSQGPNVNGIDMTLGS